MTCAETQEIGWAREHRYYHLLKPWVHYVPVREYLEDLVPQVIPPCSHTSETIAFDCLLKDSGSLFSL